MDAFAEIVRITDLPSQRDIALEGALTSGRGLRCDDGKGSWRRNGVSEVGRKLIRMLQRRRLTVPSDHLGLVLDALEEPLTVAELAEAAVVRAWLAGKTACMLRHIGALAQVGQAGNT